MMELNITVTEYRINSPSADTVAECWVRCENETDYRNGNLKRHFPVPAIPDVHQWDYSLGILLLTVPPLTEDELDREEEEWQDYLDSLDNRE